MTEESPPQSAPEESIQEGSTPPADNDAPSIVRRLGWVLPTVLLVGLWLWQALSGSPHTTEAWLLPTMAMGIFAAIIAVTTGYTRRPRQLSLLVLGLFLIHSLWLTAGMWWSDAPHAAWMAAARTYGGLTTLALGMCLLTGWASRMVFRVLLLVASLALVAFVMIWAATHPAGVVSLFVGNPGSAALALPGGGAEIAAALALALIWPLLWQASDPKSPPFFRGVALAAVFGLISLGVLAQSSAAWLCLGTTAVLGLAFFPGRLRVLVCALVPAVMMVWAFPGLNDYAVKGPEVVGAQPLEFILIVGMIVTGFIGTILSLLENWVHVSRRMRFVFSALVLAAVTVAGTYGYMILERQVGEPRLWLQTQAADILGIRQSSLELPKEQWRVAWRQYERHQWTGVGTGGMESHYLREREVPEPYEAGTGSWFFHALGENGLPGAGLIAIGLLCALVGMVWPRFSSGWRAGRATWLFRNRAPTSQARWGLSAREFGWEFSLALAVTYCLLHAAIRPIWSEPAVAGLTMLLLSSGVAGVDARARVLWPQVSRHLAAQPTRLLMDQTAVQQGMSGPQDRHTRRTPGDGQSRGEAAAGFTGLRRAHRHLERKQRTERRAARHRRRLRALRPPGPLSQVFRWALIGAGVVTTVLALIPFLAVALGDVAVETQHDAPTSAARLARTAERIMPYAADPPLVEAGIYEHAAEAVLATGDPGRYAAAADNQALRAVALEQAAARINDSWYLWYAAGLAIVDLIDIRTAHAAQAQPYAPGEASGSLALSDDQKAACAQLRSYKPAALVERARTHLALALGRNPLEPAVLRALAELEGNSQ